MPRACRPPPLGPVAALMALWPCAEARAAFGDPEVRAGFSGGYTCYADSRRYHGLGGALRADYAFGPTWALGVRYGLGAHDIRGADFMVHQVGLGTRFQLDVFEYVPWLELAPGVYVATGEGGPREDTSGGVRAGLGFDRLLDERVDLNFGVHYHRLFGESRFPAYLEIHLGVGFRCGLGDPLAP